MNLSSERRKIYLRLAVGYLAMALLIIMFLAFSIIQGAGWKPIIVGLPMFLTFFIGVSYYFIKSIHALRRRESGESEPQKRRGPWEDEN